MKNPSNKNMFTIKPFTDHNHEFYNIPLLGQVRLDDPGQSAGNYSIGELINNIRQDDAQSISLQAIDDGLAAIGILRGDFLTVMLNKPLKDNDIAVVLLGRRLYIRKIYFIRDLIRLETAAPRSSPLIIEPKTPGFEIIGKVTSVIREL